MFERIPLVIFDIIHSYLSHHEYRNFLNTGRDTFAEVKYETVYYNLKKFDDLTQFKDATETSLVRDKRRHIFETIKRNVKSQQNQISLKWHYPSLEGFITFKHCIADIDCFTLVLKGTFILPLHILANIRHLSLDRLSNTSLEGLSGAVRPQQVCPHAKGSSIQVLMLTDCSNLEDISEIEQLPFLKKVIIFRCRKIEDVSFLANIEEVKLYHIREISYIAGYKQKSLTLHVPHCPLGGENTKPYEPCDTSFLFSLRHLTNLSLSCFFHPSCNFFTAFSGKNNDNISADIKCCHISNLTIRNYSLLSTVNSGKDYVFPVFPQLYYLISVDIMGFDLSSWNETISSLSSVTLRSCVLPVNLSCFKFVSRFSLENIDVTILNFSEVFHNLQRLRIECFQRLTSLIINSNVKHLNFHANHSLQTISNIGIVKSLTIYGCSRLTEINGLEKANFVRLVGLGSLSDFSFLLKISSKLTIERCHKFIRSYYESRLKGIPVVELMDNDCF
jgi:hypothetical protein